MINEVGKMSVIESNCHITMGEIPEILNVSRTTTEYHIRVVKKLGIWVPRELKKFT